MQTSDRRLADREVPERPHRQLASGPVPLLRCAGGTLLLPAADLVLVDAVDGGNLVVLPPREVWERSELPPVELAAWSCLVAAAGRAMLDRLPQLAGGCVNYWEAGNWSLHHAAEPVGAKTAREHRRVHLHLLGRAVDAVDPDWRWGEAPRFPSFADRHAACGPHRRLDGPGCFAVVERTARLLVDRYGSLATQIAWRVCGECGYPTAVEQAAPCGGCGAPSTAAATAPATSWSLRSQR